MQLFSLFLLHLESLYFDHHPSPPSSMSQRSIISNFNLHGELPDEDEGGEDVVELIRPPSRQNLLYGQTGIRGPSMTVQLHVTEDNPYDPRNMIYGGPLLRCSSRRSCPSCQIPPCSTEETQCTACLNGEGVYCLHRTPCHQWNPCEKQNIASAAHPSILRRFRCQVWGN